jgi:hypothetical protein
LGNELNLPLGLIYLFMVEIVLASSSNFFLFLLFGNNEFFSYH